MANPRIELKAQSAKYVISRDVLLCSNEDMMKNSLVDRTWWTIDQQILKNCSKKKPKTAILSSNLNKFKRSKAIRIFVSSTFTDFFNERELLVKFVFPELREWCHKRNLDLVECDLRWGVPADSTNEDTILACLSELDRCLDENDGQPFFIGMLGDKYGWVPEMESLTTHIKQTYSWVPNISITHMEFLHGAIRCQNKNACFFLRDRLSKIPDDHKNKFFESNPDSIAQLKALKQKLSNFFPDQVFKYSCEYDKINETTGRKKVKLKNFKNFAEQALKFLIASIQKSYPDLNPIYLLENPAFDSNEIRKEKLEIFFQDELSYQDLLVVEMTNFFVGYDKELLSFAEKIENYSSGLIVGERGAGKTSFMAMVIKAILAKKNNSDKEIFYHFSDSTSFSQFHRAFASRFIFYYRKMLNLDEELTLETAYDSSVMLDSFNRLVEILNKKNIKILIFIDGFSFKKTDYFNLLTLSSKFSNLIFVFTCTNEECFEFNLKNCLKVSLNGFGNDRSKNFIENFLKKYNKRLDNLQMSLILEKSSDLKSPLWLSYVCEELRVFGEFTTVNQKIQTFPSTLAGLIHFIIDRINTDFPNDIIKEILCLICLTRNGIPENEVSLLLKSCGFDTNRLECAQIIRNLKIFLKFSYYQKSQLISLKQDYISEIINKKFLQNRDTFLAYHEKIIHFLRNISNYRTFSCLELCHHYKVLGNKRQFAEFLKTHEAYRYINVSFRSFLYNDLRCKFIANKTAGTNLKMCLSCSNKIGHLSPNSPNKNSCFVCGSFFTVGSKFVYKCIKHSDHNINQASLYKCCICNTIYQKPRFDLNVSLVFDANLCKLCRDLNCCALEFQ